MERVRTHLFIPHGRKIEKNQILDGGLKIETPLWYQNLNVVLEVLSKLEKQVENLKDLQKKRILPGFKNKIEIEKSITKARNGLTKGLMLVQKKIQDIVEATYNIYEMETSTRLSNGLNIGLNEILRDITISYQKLLSKSIENNPIMTKDPINQFKPESNVIEDDQILKNSIYVNMPKIKNYLYDEEDIKEIETSIIEISTLLQQINRLVSNQSNVLDRIDLNTENTLISSKKALKELQNRLINEEKRYKALKFKFLIASSILLMILLIEYIY